MFTYYKVLRKFHFGALRTTFEADDFFEANGTQVRVGDIIADVPNIESLVEAGFFEPTDEKPKQVTVVKKQVGFSGKKHTWVVDGFGSGSKVCSTCGAQLKNPNNINVTKESLTYNYIDAYGVPISSFKELPCPLFVGDFGGGIATNTARTRDLKNDVESIEERVIRLEAESKHYREEAEKAKKAALTLLERFVQVVEAAPENIALPDYGDIIEAVNPESEFFPISVNRSDPEDSGESG